MVQYDSMFLDMLRSVSMRALEEDKNFQVDESWLHDNLSRAFWIARRAQDGSDKQKSPLRRSSTLQLKAGNQIPVLGVSVRSGRLSLERLAELSEISIIKDLLAEKEGIGWKSVAGVWGGAVDSHRGGEGENLEISRIFVSPKQNEDEARSAILSEIRDLCKNPNFHIDGWFLETRQGKIWRSGGNPDFSPPPPQTFHPHVTEGPPSIELAEGIRSCLSQDREIMFRGLLVEKGMLLPILINYRILPSQCISDIPQGSIAPLVHDEAMKQAVASSDIQRRASLLYCIKRKDIISSISLLAGITGDWDNAVRFILSDHGIRKIFALRRLETLGSEFQAAQSFVQERIDAILKDLSVDSFGCPEMKFYDVELIDIIINRTLAYAVSILTDDEILSISNFVNIDPNELRQVFGQVTVARKNGSASQFRDRLNVCGLDDAYLKLVKRLVLRPPLPSSFSDCALLETFKNYLTSFSRNKVEKKTPEIVEIPAQESDFGLPQLGEVEGAKQLNAIIELLAKSIDNYEWFLSAGPHVISALMNANFKILCPILDFWFLGVRDIDSLVDSWRNSSFVINLQKNESLVTFVIVLFNRFQFVSCHFAELASDVPIPALFMTSGHPSIEMRALRRKQEPLWLSSISFDLACLYYDFKCVNEALIAKERGSLSAGSFNVDYNICKLQGFDRTIPRNIIQFVGSNLSLTSDPLENSKILRMLQQSVQLVDNVIKSS